MPTMLATHVLDTSVFIQAHRQFYSIDICPGFWACLQHHASTGRLVSVDRVLGEIQAGKDALTSWATHSVNRSFFAGTSDVDVMAHFSTLMNWAQSAPQFLPAARTEFARVADAWVIAYAKAHGLTVVTQEAYAVDARKKVPMPNACRAIGVSYVNAFNLLRALNAKLTWTP